jgi:DNA-binding protein H-NS
VARTLAQIKSEIARLEKQREALRAEEVAGVIARIREAIDFYGLTAADLGLGGRTRAKPDASAKKRGGRPARRRVGAIRYRDEHGREWTGRGRPPTWFKEALAAGKAPEDLSVK